jgi:rfaE bifunctional protein nucleotidyltransferase chain/domain
VRDATRERLRRGGADPDKVETAANALVACLRSGGKVLVFGNGGSAADAQHMAAELVGRFLLERRALPAIALTTDTSALTAIANDFGFEQVFARQIEALGRRGDVAVAISTSGRSPNVLAAVRAATAAGLRTIGIVGPGGSDLERLVELPVVVDADGPALQEGQLTVEHALCEIVEAALAGETMTETVAGKVVTWEELLEERERWREQGLRVVWTNGAFDLLHVGHVRSLEAARGLGDVLVVGVNSDESVRGLKGDGRPLVPAEQRAEILAALAVVDRVVMFDEPTPEAALAKLQPDVHTKGADYADRDLPERAVVESYGGAVELLPFVPGISTSELERRLRDAPS